MNPSCRSLIGLLLSVVLLPATAPAREISDIDGSTITRFESPNRVIENCLRIPEILDGNYSKKDREKEEAFCAVDFYYENTALCPKTWSTSPGTIVHLLDANGFSGSAAEFEAEKCGGRSLSKFAKFKQTMNAQGTSGTFSQSSLVYYHLSRYFDADVFVPPSIYREMDRKVHLERVAKRGQQKTTSGMIDAGWDHLVNADYSPSSYKPMDELFTDDQEKIYGIFIDGSGERYGAVINGIRSAWGIPQNNDFQETPAFTALRTEEPLMEAIQKTLGNYGSYIQIKKSVQKNEATELEKALPDISAEQMVFWMSELSEIAIMDFILSQQDRIGNIDYKWYWYWIEDGKVERKREKSEVSRTRMSSLSVPADIAQYHPILLQRTQLNDNDAGTSHRYANFTKKTEMLEKIRHLRASVYRKLMHLNADFQNKGPLYIFITKNFGLSERDSAGIIKNTQLARNILNQSCKARKLRFDLEPEKFLTQSLAGQPIEVESVVNCDSI